MKTKDLRLTEICYYDTFRNDIMVPTKKAYTFLQKVDSQYRNVFTPEIEYPIYEIVPYSNITKNYWEFGTKYQLLRGKCEDGICYVIHPFSMEDVLRVEEITKEELEEMIVKSNQFFIDRIDILQREKNSFFNKQLWDDKKKRKEFQQYLDSCSRGVQYYK